MANLFVTEFDQAHIQAGVATPVANVMQQVEQTPIAIAGASAQSAAFGANTRLVRVHAGAICSIAFGANPTATTNNMRLSADQTEYFAVVPGLKVAVISNT